MVVLSLRETLSWTRQAAPGGWPLLKSKARELYPSSLKAGDVSKILCYS